MLTGLRIATARSGVCLLVLALTSCSWSSDDEAAGSLPVGAVAQALTDTDGDGLEDSWEIEYFGNLSQTAAGDYDSDGMTNLEEYTRGFVPTVDDGFDDADGDRYPNVFEVRRGSDPNDASSSPTANYVVNGAGGGTHTTIGAAVTAANVANGAYQIIGVAPGLYSGVANLRNVTLSSTKPKLLIIGLEGAAKTIIEGGLTGVSNYGWLINNSAVIASLTFQKITVAQSVDAPSKRVRFVDLMVRDNIGPSWAAGVYVNSAAKVDIIGSTFLDNVGIAGSEQIWVGGGAASLVNTVVWGQSSGTLLAKATSATLTTSYTLVKGQTLAGTGNLAGNVDPRIRSDGHLLWDSPLRGAGGTVVQSRMDLDVELRPSSAPDIGVDQFVDSDGDQLADEWELDNAGNLTTLTGRTQDGDGDGVSNEGEYASYTNPTVADTDGDGLSDGAELSTNGTNPLLADTDGDDMPDGWEVTYGLSPLVANGFEDADGDRYPNVFEYARSSNPADRTSVPTANYTVNAAGGGTHTTIGAALSAANVANGAYQVIGIAPGTYTGAANLRDVTVAATKPKLLFIGLEGAAKTVIDGDLANYGWLLNNAAVVSSLTFQKMTVAFYVDAAGKDFRFVDLIVRDNVGPSWAGGVHVNAAANVQIVGSTFLNNTGASAAQQIWIGVGAGTVVNTAVYGASGTMVAKATSATLATSYCFVKGQTLTGTGNLAGTVDPKLRSDGHLLWDSPLRAAGGSVAQSRLDLDGELRPSSAPDIGVDQFVDTDGDQLADKWELDYAGDLTTLTGRAQDGDADGLSNEGEYANRTNPGVADSDGDGVSDGAEVSTYGTNPLVTDTDGDEMPDGWETTYGLAATVSNRFDDSDGDGYPNIFEYARGSNPSDIASKPTANFVVDGAGGGTHTTIGAAVTAANVANGAYQIIGIAPGSYSGASNDVTLTTAKPKLLVIGLQGAAKTFIEGAGSWGWSIQNTAVISSLTFRGRYQAVAVNAPSQEVRLVDLVIRDNANGSWPAGVDVIAGKAWVISSTLANNVGPSQHRQMKIDSGGSVTLLNTVIWGTDSGTTIAKATGATLTANNSLAKGMTLTGTGNLAATIDPKLRSDGHLLWDSPLRATGGTLVQSRLDMDGELRPSSTPDIGADQFIDTDGDQLADKWELDYAGNLTTLTGRVQDGDADGLSNEGEYANRTDPGVSDTDGDGVSDGAEVSTYATNPLSTDTDGDEMPDGWEVTYGLAATVSNRFDDPDGDGYPNIFEYARGSNPSDIASKPTPNFVVNGAGGGTHTTIGDALSAADVANGAYQIIGIAPGAYSGASNDITIPTTKPKLLVIGLEGAGKTFIEGEGSWGWMVQNTAVISSLTFRGRYQGVAVNAPSQEVRLVNLVVRDNANGSWPGAVDVIAGKVYVIGSTLANNAGPTQHRQMKVDSGGSLTLLNTVVWGTATGTTIALATGATLDGNNSLVKGQTLTGTANLAGTVDPKLRSDMHLRASSPLRGAGGSIAQARLDLDGELRPVSGRDIGADQFIDADTDGLPDTWEIAAGGNATAIEGVADADSDELSNAGEYDLETDWLDPDTDRDGVYDGLEVTLGTNPLVADSDELASDLNGDGVIDSVGAQLGHQPDQLDSDGDGVSNADERLMCTNPLRVDTDGDGVPDNTDAFPLDPLVSALPSDPLDVTAPVITLTAPWYAVEQ